MAQWQRIFLPSRRLRRRRFDPWVGKISWGRKIAAHSSILTWEIPWIEEPAGPQSWGRKESDMTEHAHTHGSQWESGGDLADQGLQGPFFPCSLRWEECFSSTVFGQCLIFLLLLLHSCLECL